MVYDHYIDLSLLNAAWGGREAYDGLGDAVERLHRIRNNREYALAFPGLENGMFSATIRVFGDRLMLSSLRGDMMDDRLARWMRIGDILPVPEGVTCFRSYAKARMSKGVRGERQAERDGTSQRMGDSALSKYYRLPCLMLRSASNGHAIHLRIAVSRYEKSPREAGCGKVNSFGLSLASDPLPLPVFQ